jgi:hypothetical protein
MKVAECSFAEFVYPFLFEPGEADEGDVLGIWGLEGPESMDVGTLGRSWPGVVGDRSEATGQRLWEAIPEAYRGFWAAYALVFPPQTHNFCRQEVGPAGSYRALAQHRPLAVSPLRAQDTVLLQVAGLA